jgi:hypothetical protein
MLTRDQILDADDRKFTDVDVPEWGGKLRVKTMTSAERQRFQAKVQAQPKGVPDDLMEQIVVACVVDENGDNLFSLEDIDILSSKSSIPIATVFSAAAELNGMTKGSIEQIKGE